MNLPKTLVIAGLFLVALGLLLWVAPRIPGLDRLGRLPGDIRYESDRVKVYIPWVTCLILSLILTLVLRFFGRGK